MYPQHPFLTTESPGAHSCHGLLQELTRCRYFSGAALSLCCMAVFLLPGGRRSSPPEAKQSCCFSSGRGVPASGQHCSSILVWAFNPSYSFPCQGWAGAAGSCPPQPRHQPCLAKVPSEAAASPSQGQGGSVGLTCPAPGRTSLAVIPTRLHVVS